MNQKQMEKDIANLKETLRILILILEANLPNETSFIEMAKETLRQVGDP